MEDKSNLIRTDRLYESLRFAEYDMTSGIAEIIDNSIEAKASKIYIDIDCENIKNTQGKKKEISVIKEITIVDNGLGMDEEILSKCLVLGESCRKVINGKKGIGRFGVGLTLGGISLSRRIEVYSRNNVNDKFKYSYIDLDEIGSRELVNVPAPIEKDVDEKDMQYLKDSTGTIIKLKKCDRLREDEFKGKKIEASQNKMGLETFIGRTYRKFISAGLDIYIDGCKVFLHDPLYLDGPTRFDSKDSVDLKATVKGEETITLEIPNSKGETADIKIKMSLLPKEWRKEKGDGGKQSAKDRKIQDNEGISILRADREVLYGKVEYVFGSKNRGTARYERIDRFWGCEISFPPELDDYFHVRYIKRGAEPIPALRDKIREKIGPVVNELRKEIASDWSKECAEEQKKSGAFNGAEKAMESIDNKLPRSVKGESLSKGEADKKIDDLLDHVVTPEGEKKEEYKEKKRDEINNKLYTIELVDYPKNIFFEKEYILGKVIIKLNINHPFYTKVLLPLCETSSDGDEPEKMLENSKIKDAIVLILFSYAKAEAMFDGNEELFENFTSQWGIILGTAVNEVFK